MRSSPDKPYVTDFRTNMPPSSYDASVASNKENFAPSQSQLPIPVSYAGRAAMPNSYFPKMPHWNSDIFNRDGSSVFSSYNRHNPDKVTYVGVRGRHAASYTPLENGDVRSKKEGLAQHGLNLSEHQIRHDRGSFPSTSVERVPTKKADSSENASSSGASMTAKITPGVVEIIDVDAIDPALDSNPPLDTTRLSPVKSLHKPGMSSMDSTGRLEQKLFSALGEELASFDSHVGHTDMSSALTDAFRVAASDLGARTYSVSLATEPEAVGKRKRQNTLGGDRDRNPLSKREKGKQSDVEEREEEDVSHPMGD
jgi:hypothetical protein